MQRTRFSPSRVVMCPPAYYEIPSVGNVHMDVDNQPQRELAYRQWTLIKNLYEMLGLNVYEVAPDRHLYDMTFAANGGWGRYNSATDTVEVVVSNFKLPSRQYESDHFRRILQDMGCTVFELPNQIKFEGQGDVVENRNMYLMGYGPRTDKHAALYLSRLLRLQRPVALMRLVDKRFYHLDTCLFSLPLQKSCIYYPGAFDEVGRGMIEDMTVKKFKVSESLAERFVCNSVFVGNTILLNVPFQNIQESSLRMSEAGKTMDDDDMRFQEIVRREAEYSNLIRFLWGLGVDIIPVYTSEFEKSGAGVRCLTLFVD